MSDVWSDDQISRDDFLGGRLKIAQPLNGYRAGIDPVLLAAAVPAREGDSVLELGCGVGVASLCLGRRVAGVKLTGLEIQPAYAELARSNAVDNDIAMKVMIGDLADMPSDLRQCQFTHVMANPPYFDRNSSTAAQDDGRETALGEKTPLAAWVKAAAKRTEQKGFVTFVQRSERLPDLLSEARRYLGGIEVLPLIPRTGRTARLILVRGRRGGRAEFRLHDGWVLHDGKVHEADQENYTKATACVLRDGAPLPFSS